MQLRAQGVRPDDIDHVEIRLPSAVLRTVAEPRNLKIRPPTGYAARFSSPFTFAAAMRGGGGLGLFLEDLTDERVVEPATLELAAKVSCVAAERCDQLFPNRFPAIVTVELRGRGRERVEIVENRGGPARPLTDEESSAKFRACAARMLTEAEIADLDCMLTALEQLPELDGFVNLLSIR